MKSPFINTLVFDEAVTAQFLVLSKEIRQKKTGEPYLSLHLSDRTGEIEAKMWDNVTEVMNTFERDHFVKVKGLPQLYNNRSQFVIHRLRRLDDDEVDFADYFPCAERTGEEMFSELENIIGSIANPHLRALLDAVFADEEITKLYKIAPAAKSIHHACRSGLIEHVLSLCELGRLTAIHYPEVDRDLLLTGVILHDIGKVEELAYARSFGYTAEGQLLGHIILGLRLVGAKFNGLPDFPHRLRILVEHMIISHHGELEFGSPKVPLFAEALLLHHLDNLDSKMNAMRTVLRRDVHAEGDFTSWIASLERVLLRKERFLNETPKTAPPAAQPAASEPAAPAANHAPPPPPLQETAIQSQKEAAPQQPRETAPLWPAEALAPAPIPSPEHPAPNPAVPADRPAVSADRSVPRPAPVPARPLPATSAAERPAPRPPVSQNAPVTDRKHEGSRGQMNTLFGEKLQAVLSERK